MILHTTPENEPVSIPIHRLDPVCGFPPNEKETTETLINETPNSLLIPWVVSPETGVESQKNLASECSDSTQSLHVVEDLEEAIRSQTRLLELVDDGNLKKANILERISILYWLRYKQFKETTDIENARKSLEQVLLLVEDDYPGAGYMLNMLGDIYITLFEISSDLDNLRKSIDYLQKATQYFNDDNAFKAAVLSNLADAHSIQFEKLGNLNDLNNTIACGEATRRLLSEEDYPSNVINLWKLGDAHLSHFKRTSELKSADKALAHQEDALLRINNISLKIEFLDSLSHTYRVLFSRSENVAYAYKAISHLEQILTLITDATPQRLRLLIDLAALIELCLSRTGSAHIDHRTSYCLEQAAHLVLKDHLSQPKMLEQLGTVYVSCFIRCGDPRHIFQAISLLEAATDFTWDGVSDRPKLLYSLASSYLLLFRRFGDTQTIDKAVGSYEQAVFMASDDYPNKSTLLAGLGDAYRSRFSYLNRCEDIEKAIACQKQALSLTSNDDPLRAELLSLLGCAIHFRFGYEGDLDDLTKAITSIEEAVETAKTGSTIWLGALANLANAQHSMFRHAGIGKSIEMAVHYQEQVVRFTPLGHCEQSVRLNNLGIFYQALFEHSGKLEDIDKAIEFGVQAEQLIPNDHPSKPDWLNNLGNSYWCLYERLESIEDLHKSISCLERAMQLTPNYHPEAPRRFECLGISYMSLFNRLGDLDIIDRGLAYFEQAVLQTPDGHLYKPRRLGALGSAYMARFARFENVEDLRQAIVHQSNAASLTPDDHPEKPGTLCNLGRVCYRFFKHSDDSEYLKKSVECHQSALAIITEDHANRPLILMNAGLIYLEESCRLKESRYALKSMLYFREAALASLCDPITRFEASKLWAGLSPWSLDAYSQCMAILPQVVWLGNSVAHRHEQLAQNVQGLVTQAIAAAISLQEYDKALEWLEQGRAMVWNQILQLRSPLHRLYAIDPALAQDLRNIADELDRASFQSLQAPFSDSRYSISDDASRSHRRLAEKWEQLLNRVRLISGFEEFLLSPKAKTIISRLHSKIVVVINVHGNRCDALIIRGDQDGGCMHSPLPDFSFEKAKLAHKQLSALLRNGSLRGVVKHQNRSNPNNSFRAILAMLWYDVAKPVLDCLGFSQTMPADELPHITWCTTGPLAFLPLHAAGDYSHQASVLANLAISSYTPTLSALDNNPVSLDTFSGILAVGQTSTLGMAPLPGATIELDEIALHARNLNFTRLEDNMASADSVMSGMENHSWVHFACHASQSELDPLQSAFHLHTSTLDLGTIAKRPLKNAQLAYLSACQTAMGDKTLPEEAAHLAAGLMMAGYQTVVATMWSISDQYAPLVASKFYKYMLTGEAPDATRAAKSLHKAVADLRSNVGVDNFEAWVPYIHIGC